MESLPSNPQIPANPTPVAGKPTPASWWIVPTLLFIAMTILTSWADGHLNASAPDHAMGYIIGNLIGGVGMAGIVASVAYFVGRKLSRVATIAFAIMICIVSLGLGMQSWERFKRRTNAAPEMISFRDFRFEIPATWQKAKPPLEQTLALVVLDDHSRNGPHAIVQVDSAKTVAIPGQMAQAAAGNGGRIFPDPVSIDGINAIRVETNSSVMTYPRFIVVLVRGDRGYIITAAEENGADVSGPFEQILKTWRWNEIH